MAEEISSLAATMSTADTTPDWPDTVPDTDPSSTYAAEPEEWSESYEESYGQYYGPTEQTSSSLVSPTERDGSRSKRRIGGVASVGIFLIAVVAIGMVIVGSGYAKELGIHEPSSPKETETVAPEAAPRASQRRAFVPATYKSSPPSAPCIDDEDEHCNNTNTTATDAGTSGRVGTTATNGSSAHGDNDDGEKLMVVPPAGRLDEDNDDDSLQTEKGPQPESKLGKKDSAARGSVAKDGGPKPSVRKDHAAKDRSSNAHPTTGSVTKNPVTKAHTASGPAAWTTRSKGQATTQFPKRDHKPTATSMPHGPTGLTHPVRTSATLLCAYGNWTSVDTSFPEDGLCDYAFFDSLYRGLPRDSDVARLGRPSAALRHFLARNSPATGAPR
ncbi:hypothetical protein MTO96_021917 [Rhipicephalus appendiculatus]